MFDRIFAVKSFFANLEVPQQVIRVAASHSMYVLPQHIISIQVDFDDCDDIEESLNKLYARRMPDTPAAERARLVKIATCYFHVQQACHNNAHLLPRNKEDSPEALRNVSQLAMCPPDIFPRAWRAIRAHWEDKCWDQWLQYFETTWIKNLPGWDVQFLGALSPRSNGGLEGQWPLLHRIIKGVVTLRTLIHQVHKYLIPHYVQEGTRVREPLTPSIADKRCLMLRDRQEAVRLSTEPNDRVRSRVIGTERFWYAKRRVLGAGRPPIYENEVDAYEFLLESLVWDYRDVLTYPEVQLLQMCVRPRHTPWHVLPYVRCSHH
jgi:hypothetical protein